MRVANTNGDFSYIMLPTLQLYLTQPRPPFDLDIHQPSVSDVEFVACYTEQPQALVFQFVRGDGIKSRLNDLL